MSMATSAIIATAAIAGGSTAASIYGSRAAANQNRRAIDAGERSDTRAAEIEAARVAEEKRRADLEMANAAEERRVKKENYDLALARDAERWKDYLRINEPYWKQGAGVLGSLYDIAGMGGGAPAFQMPMQPPPSGGGPPPPGLVGGRTTTAGLPPGHMNRSAATSTGREFPMLPMPSSGSGNSLQSLMQLAQMASSGRRPSPVDMQIGS